MFLNIKLVLRKKDIRKDQNIRIDYVGLNLSKELIEARDNRYNLKLLIKKNLL
tara:strand:- start:305 stop:463 length:159 start_codon:yes stop_codon:yes gene_type:complete